MMDEMSLTEIKRAFGKVFEKAANGEVIVGTDRGKRTIAVVPVGMLDKFLLYEQRELRALIDGRKTEETTRLTDELDAAVTAIEQTAGAAPDSEA